MRLHKCNRLPDRSPPYPLANDPSPPAGRWNRLPDELCASLSECFTPEAKANMQAGPSKEWSFSEQIADLFKEDEAETFELLV